LNINFQRVWLPVFALILLPVVVHLLFSPLGFSPTDDGFTLAYARRWLDGQVPHRDFIIIRPAFSPLLHTPEVLLGGEATYLLSRLVACFQFALIAWLWALMILHHSRVAFPAVITASLVSIIFMLSAHTFPLMAWHTIDGLTFVSAGLAARFLLPRRWRPFAYLLVGTSAICKQSFLLTAPLLILALSDWRDFRCWAAAALPGLLYAVYLWLNGALEAGVQQLSSQTGLVQTGLASYLTPEVLLGVLLGAVVTRQAAYRQIPFRLTTSVFTVLLLIGAASLISTVFSFMLFGFLVGFALVQRRQHRSSPFVSLALSALVTAWSASLSLGYNTPVLVSGPLAAVFLVYVGTQYQSWMHPRLLVGASMALAVMVGAAFVSARLHAIYRDQPASQLTYDLGGIVPGMAGIRTNANTFTWLADLQQAVKTAASSGLRYAIIPDVAGWWVKSSQSNPLPIDWVLNVELNSQALVARVIDSLNSQRGKLVVIVENHDVNRLAEGLFPLIEASLEHEVVRYVRETFTPAATTEFFTLYR
jgi:hypothetical protein